MFDEGRFVDTNYDVDLKNCVFICTTNFNSEDEIKKILGPAMFSRIGDCIKYQELNKDEKEIIEKTDIKIWFLKNVDRYDNIRILKNKIEKAIFETLTEKIILN